MKHIFLNLKRFDVAKEQGGINQTKDIKNWSTTIIEGVSKGVENFKDSLSFCVFLPEGHILMGSEEAKKVQIGCQGVYRRDVEVGKNFGAFTTFQTAKSAKGLGAKVALIGHCEERNNLREIIELGKGVNFNAIDEILNEEVKRAIESGLDVLFCVGERFEEQERKYEVLKNQLEVGLKDVELDRVIVAYEPVWAIGPNRPVPTREYIEKIAKHIKSEKNVKVVYGGGLKKENAEMIASIEALDGGLIALTSFGEDFGFSVDGFIDIVLQYNKMLTIK